MQHMEKASLYNVDGNRVATPKQLYAVGSHFGKLHGSTPSEAFRLGKVFGAIMLKFNAEHCETPITHGDVSQFFELKTVPAKFLERITTKTIKTTKTSKKSIAEAKPTKTSKKPEAQKDLPVAKSSDSSLTDFKARLDALASKQADTDKKLESIDTKMDLIMAFLETNPDA